MKYARTLLFSALLGCGAAIAQEANPYDGSWTATWQTLQGKQHLNEGVVVVAGKGGTFENLARTRRNPCVGLKAPISVKTASADELIFVIEFSSALRGCSDSKVRLKRINDQTLKGLRNESLEITLTRK